MFDAWSRDLRQALRRLARSPSFTLVTVATLALGIGANTALFSVVEGVLLRSLPFEEADRLVLLPRPDSREADLSILDGLDLRAESRTLESLALFMPNWSLDLVGDTEPVRLVAAVVEPEWFDVLGVEATHGRVLTASDNQASAERVAVVSEGFFERQLGGSVAVLGQSLTLSGEPWVVVGVVPDRTDVFRQGTELWIPPATATPWAMSERGTNNFEVIGRMAPGVTVSEAGAEITALTEALAAEYPDTNQGKVLEAVDLRSFLVGPVRPALVVLAAAVGLVLLIACVNLSSLMLVRTSAGAQERAIRQALGGRRLDVARPRLIEGLVLGAVGGLAGITIARFGTAALLRLAPEALPRADEVGIDATVLGFALFATLLAIGVVLGLPSLSWSRRGVTPLLGGLRTGAGPARQRSLGALVVAEVALAFVLLLGAGLLSRSFQNLSRVDLGFEPEGILTASLVLPETRYSEPERQTRAFEGIVARLAETPGVESASFVIGAPLDGFGSIGSRITFDDRPPPREGEAPSARLRPVIGDYFATLGIPVLEGRTFEPTDRATSPAVAVVNQSFARRYWPDGEVVGKRLAITMTGGDPVWREVVGVVADVKSSTLAGGDSVAVYFPYPQREMSWARFGTLLARTTGRAEALAPQMGEALWSVDPSVPLDRVASMSERLRAAKAGERFLTTLMLLFAAVAVVIALQGLYGVLSYVVAQRQHEIGVRAALGASARVLLRAVLGRGLALVGTGLGIGVVAALGLARGLESVLFEVSSRDPATLFGAAFLLLAAALVACLVPAARAARLDPVSVLRSD